MLLYPINNLHPPKPTGDFQIGVSPKFDSSFLEIAFLATCHLPPPQPLHLANRFVTIESNEQPDGAE
ncbi:hypothetical protein SBA3_3290003 [Candidatus Sulfopaludibacter sp. SbA3]|nr:hypothetical protein SBA3_3290003 [Candidatus Sulfopaludibacter sp. SbA3]